MSIKQVIVVRKDLNMSRGKGEAQVAHASMKVFFENSIFTYRDTVSYEMVTKLSEDMYLWASGIFKKISLSCSSEEELDELYSKAKKADLPCAMVVDSGLTEFHNIPTKTCIAIGPAKSEDIDKITGHLKLR